MAKGIAILAFILLASVLVAQQNQNQNQGNRQKTKGLLKDILLDDFENSEDWRAFSTTPLGETKTRKTIQLGEIRDVFNPELISTEEKQMFKEGENHILGIKTFFKDRGFDRVEVKPPHELKIKGVVRQFSMWVLGRKYRHTLFIKLRDFTGKIHKLRVGRLDFLGWRKMTVTVPGWIPQSPRYSLLDKNLQFVSFFVVSDVHEVGGPFYFYVDNLSLK
ncbi:MAG: endoflagellar filament sheath protein, partial [Candidatus Hydrogenedentota bacterium]